MADRATRVQELSGAYSEILRELNSSNLPEWLQLDLTFQQMKVLYILKQKGPLKMRDLSNELKVTMPTITGIVNRLIDRRDGSPLLTRMVSPEDRREVWAHLTEAGIEATEMLNRINAKMLANALSQLSEADLESMHGPLLRLSEAVKEQAQAAKPAEAEVPLPSVISPALVTDGSGSDEDKDTVEVLLSRSALS